MGRLIRAALLLTIVGMLAGAVYMMVRQTIEEWNRDEFSGDRIILSLQLYYGNYQSAETSARSLLERDRQKSGERSQRYADSLTSLAIIYHVQGRYAEAVALFEQSLKLTEELAGASDSKVAIVLLNLAASYREQGRTSEAISHLERAIAIEEQELGPSDTALADSLNNLGAIYVDQNRFADAEPLFRRALDLARTNPHLMPSEVAGFQANLAVAQFSQGKFQEAEQNLDQTLAAEEKGLGKENPKVATTLAMLAGLRDRQGRDADAAQLYERALEVREKTLGPTHPDVSDILANLSNVYGELGQVDKAKSFGERALAIREQNFGPQHPQVAISLNNLAVVTVSNGDFTKALDLWRRSTRIIVDRTLRGAGSRAGERLADEETERRATFFDGLVKGAHRVAEHGGDRDRLAGETFEAAQWSANSRAGQSLQQMAVRSAAREPALSALVRERQDLAGEWTAKDKLRIKALSTPPEKRNAAEEASLTARLREIDERLHAIDVRLVSEFPDYAALTSPGATTLAAVQSLLGPSEGLVLFLDTGKGQDMPEETYVWAVTRDRSAWVKAGLAGKELSDKIATFRKPLDLWAKSPRALARLTADSPGCAPDADPRALVRVEAAAATTCSDGAEFSLALAHELYVKLLAPVAGVIGGKQHLMIVPSGALTGLPFNALLTERARDKSASLATYRKAAWLVRRHAITILPSVASLRVLRREASTSRAPHPFVGFGDPDFGHGSAPADARGPQLASLRGVASYFRGDVADLGALRQGLPPLPDTADELHSIAKSLAAADDDVVLGPRASETTVKEMSRAGKLASYKVVAFATHGLVAGELKGLAEPAIALSVPETATHADDGLLTASEASALNLDADWVVLSACNTAAGGAPDAEALSGLSRAFFYAGARALLVSHWQVDSAAAVALTTSAFAALKSTPGLGRSQALRASMLNLIDTGEPFRAHPAYWAPFFVVGEGAAG